MTDTPAELGNTQALTHMIDSMRKGQLDVVHNGNPLGIGKRLGEGGTKTVYEAVIGDSFFALAVPNIVDGVDRMTQKWKVALQEPANTKRVGDMGLMTNSTCEAVSVNINGVPFTALKMARYQDLPFQVMDGKDSRASTVTGNVLPAELNDSSFEEYFGNIVPDVQALIISGVGVGIDSLNVCLVEGKPRLFLSDLGNAEFEQFTQEQISRVSERYVSFAFSAFLNGLTEAEYQGHKDFFNGDSFKFDNPNKITNRLAERVAKGVSRTEVS